MELVGAIGKFDIDLVSMADEQLLDRDYRRTSSDPNSGLSFRKVDIGNKDLIVDVSNGTPRPFVPYSWRRRIFDAVHGLGHPGVHRTQQAIVDRFVWPSVKADSTRWARECIACQQAKVTRHVTPPISEFEVPSQRFTHLNMDLVTLTTSNGFSHLLTIVDRFTRWPAAIPIPNIAAETVADAFAHGWVATYGVPVAITTDRGSQFSSSIWTQLMKKWGIKALTTTAYHPEANGLVERLHRRLKEALIALSNDQPQDWYWQLPLALLAIRTTLKPDIGASPADLVFGDALALPGDVVQTADPVDDQLQQRQAASLANLRVEVARLQPTPTSAHRTPRLFVPGQLDSATHVFVRRGGVQPSLSAPYEGPFRVVSRTPTGFHVRMSRGRTELIALNRLKPAHVSADQDETGEPQDLDDHQPPSPPPPGRRPGVRTRQPATTTRQTRSSTRAGANPPVPSPPEQPPPAPRKTRLPRRPASQLAPPHPVESTPRRQRNNVRNIDEFTAPGADARSNPQPDWPPSAPNAPGPSAAPTATPMAGPGPLTATSSLGLARTDNPRREVTTSQTPSSAANAQAEEEPTRETAFFAPLSEDPIPPTSGEQPGDPSIPPSAIRSNRPPSGNRVRFFSDPRPSDPPLGWRPFSSSRNNSNRPRPNVSAVAALITSHLSLPR